MDSGKQVGWQLVVSEWVWRNFQLHSLGWGESHVQGSYIKQDLVRSVLRGMLGLGAGVWERR